MEKYRVEHAKWVEGSGWSYNETIDNIDDLLTSEELGDGYGDYASSCGDEIRLIDNDTDEIVATFERT